MLNKIYVAIKNFIFNNYKEIIFLCIVAFVSFYRLPYLIYKPGGSINLASRVEIDGKSSVNGSYSMNYVSVSRGNILNYLVSFLIKDWELVKEEQVTAGYMDYETSFKLEQLEYKNSIFLATYNACKNDLCKIDIKNHEIYVVFVDERAVTDLELLDKIIAIDGKKISNFDEIRNIITNKNVDDSIKITVLENDKEVEKSAKIFEYNDNKYIGVSAYTTYDYETTPKIDIKTRRSEAGSSGGLMLTLALYDSLSTDDIAKGRKIMGTGTIDSNGNIGAIGGVKYKMLGAKKDKADIFFVPMENCEEANTVKKEYKIRYDVKCVEKFEDAVNYLTK